MTEKRHVALIGAMASGKTTVGRVLAPRLGRRLRDNDVELELRERRTPAQVAADRGLDALHQVEAEVLRATLADPEPAVVTAPASTIVDPEVRVDLRTNSIVIWLHAGPEVLVERLKAPSIRPAFDEPPDEVVAPIRPRPATRCSEMSPTPTSTPPTRPPKPSSTRSAPSPRSLDAYLRVNNRPSGTHRRVASRTTN